MSDFRDLMIAQMDDAAAGFAAEDFAGGYGRGVVGRVRRRRTVRAVSVGGVSAVAVGALAFGATKLPAGGEQPAGSVSPSPEPATSPFQCGFVMGSAITDSTAVTIKAIEWMEPADVNARQQEFWGGSTDAPQELGSQPVPTVDLIAGLARESGWGSAAGLGDPVDMDVSTDPGGSVVATGFGFVLVRDGVVVGTLIPDTADAHVGFEYDGQSYFVALLNAASAFGACPGETLGTDDLATYVVAGALVDDPTGALSAGPYYAWSVLDRP